MDPSTREKTALSSQHGIYQFTRLPFGLKNACSTFYRVMDTILSSVKCQFAFIYPDDTVFYFQILRKRINHTRFVLSLLKEAGVSLNLKTCAFFINAIDHLGHVIRLSRLQVANYSADAGCELKIQTTQTKSHSFIGFLNYISTVCPEFFPYCDPLDGQPAQVADRRAGTIKQRRVDRFADLTGEAHLSSYMLYTKKWQTIHARKKCR